MINQIFSLAMLVLGFIMIITNFQIDNALRNQNCDDTALKNSNKGILIIGVTSVVASISYMLCSFKCSSGESALIQTEMYAGFCLALSIVLIVLGSIIQSHAKNACVNAKNHTTLIIILGVIMLVLSGGYLSMYAYENMGGKEAYKRLKGSGFKGSGM
jgi:drug/metabolite transporter (DMT)-like permease